MPMLRLLVSSCLLKLVFPLLSLRSRQSIQSGIASVAMAPETLYDTAEVHNKVTETAEKPLKTLKELI